MDIFTQKKILLRSVIVLILLNLLSMGAFLWKEFANKPPRPRGDKPQEVSAVLQKELGLTEKQEASIRELRAGFFEKEAVLNNAIHRERDSMNLVMFNRNTDTAALKILARNVADHEYQMELLRIEQASRLKTILTPAQLEKMEGLVREIRDYFRPADKKD